MMIDEDYKNISVFAIESQISVKTSPHVIDQSYSRRWIYAATVFLYILRLFKWYSDENRMFPIEAILKHKQVV